MALRSRGAVPALCCCLLLPPPLLPPRRQRCRRCCRFRFPGTRRPPVLVPAPHSAAAAVACSAAWSARAAHVPPSSVGQLAWWRERFSLPVSFVSKTGSPREPAGQAGIRAPRTVVAGGLQALLPGDPRCKTAAQSCNMGIMLTGTWGQPHLGKDSVAVGQAVYSSRCGVRRSLVCCEQRMLEFGGIFPTSQEALVNLFAEAWRRHWHHPA